MNIPEYEQGSINEEVSWEEAEYLVKDPKKLKTLKDVRVKTIKNGG